MTIKYFESLVENLDHYDLKRAFIMLAESYLKDHTTFNEALKKLQNED